MTPPTQLLLAAAIGLVAGVLGGMAGIGGSMVMLPGLALVFGYHDRAHSEQHVYMAAAMCVNVLVAIPATRTHAAAGALRRELVAGILPSMIIGILAGVIASDFMGGEVLKNLLAVFIAGYCLLNIYRVFRPRTDATRPPERIGPGVLAVIGAIAGFVGGVLGLGGGAVMVPLLQVVSNVRLRQAIAASSAVMVISAAVGAALKLATLPAASGHPPLDALWFVLALAPGAVLGGILGAMLAHRLPLAAVRIAISLLLLIAALRMSAAWGLLTGPVRRGVAAEPRSGSLKRTEVVHVCRHPRSTHAPQSAPL